MTSILALTGNQWIGLASVVAGLLVGLAGLVFNYLRGREADQHARELARGGHAHELHREAYAELAAVLERQRTYLLQTERIRTSRRDPRPGGDARPGTMRRGGARRPHSQSQPGVTYSIPDVVDGLPAPSARPAPAAPLSDEDWWRITGRIAVAGSKEVRTALEVSHRKSSAFAGAVMMFRLHADRPEDPAFMAGQVNEARESALKAIDEVERLMRAELE